MIDRYKSILSSVLNFRDLGGIAIGERAIKHGMIYRSGSLSNLSEEDRKEFDRLNIDYIFDYRSEGEASASPDYTSNSSYFLLPAFAEMPGSKILKWIKSRNKGENSDNTNNPSLDKIPVKMLSAAAMPFIKLKLHSDIKKAYRALPFSNPAYAATFEKLDEGATILIHCQAGKDRTGVASALILLALGADEATITTDYMLSNLYLQRSWEEKAEKVLKVTGSKKAAGIVRSVMRTRANYLHKSLSLIKRRYSKYSEFLLKEYGIDQKRINKWRSTYLE